MARIDTGLHSGHRERMRDKFLDYGRDVFHSHELLEMLLFHAVQYKNTNPIAKKLLLRFSSVEGVLSASREELLDAEKHPEKYPNLVVRIGGYSEYFCRLSPEHRRSVIERTCY